MEVDEGATKNQTSSPTWLNYNFGMHRKNKGVVQCKSSINLFTHTGNFREIQIDMFVAEIVCNNNFDKSCKNT